MKIFGITRYSVLASGGLRQTREIPYDQRAEHVFAEARLEHRAKLFEAFVAPELRAMTRQSDAYTHIVLVSPELPSQWLARLQKTLEGVRHEIVPVKPLENMVSKCREAVLDLSDGVPFFTFRVDDDDALPPGYLSYVIANWPHKGGKAIAFDQGYYIKKIRDGKFLVSLKTVPYIALGLGLYVGRGDERRTVFCLGNHVRIAETVEVQHLTHPYWIRTIHGSNDSMQRLPVGAEHSASQFADFLRREFPAIDPGAAAQAL